MPDSSRGPREERDEVPRGPRSATAQLRSATASLPLRRGAPCALGDRSSAGRMVALLAAGSGYPRNSAREQKEAVAAA